jgi:DNA-binding transcriptional regulator YhcF (GntR family)
MRGRKPKYESRATELRQRLLVWKQSPESLRPSLRALAAETGVSHQLLSFYLKGLEQWQYKERYRRAKERAKEEAEGIRARAKAENREMTLRECLDAIVTPGLLDQIESIRQDAKRGPLNRYQIKTLKLFAKHFPEAQEVLRKCSQTDESERKMELTPEQQRLMATMPKAVARRYAHWIQRVTQ